MQCSSDPESKMHLANEWNVGVESIFLFKHEEKTKQFIVLVLGVSDICINSGSRCACCSFAADKSYAAIIRHAAEKFSFHFNFILKSSYHWIWRVFVTYLFRNLFLRLMLFSCCGLFIFFCFNQFEIWIKSLGRNGSIRLFARIDGLFAYQFTWDTNLEPD